MKYCINLSDLVSNERMKMFQRTYDCQDFLCQTIIDWQKK